MRPQMSKYKRVASYFSVSVVAAPFKNCLNYSESKYLFWPRWSSHFHGVLRKAIQDSCRYCGVTQKMKICCNDRWGGDHDHDHDHEAEIRNCITQKAGRETLPMLLSRIHHEKQPKCQTYSSVKVSHHGTYGCSCPQVSEKFATLIFLKKDEEGKAKRKGEDA